MVAKTRVLCLCILFEERETRPEMVKWWFGLVSKMCPELGIDKSHIKKVLGHATVGYFFWNSPEIGSKGFLIELIGLHRCQNYKVVARTINH
jgi:hypothetical protein